MTWVVALCLGLLLPLGHSKTVHIYVSPKGSDGNSGLDAAHPVATLDKARQLLDSSGIKDNTVYVELMGGYHNLQSTLHFTHAYSQPVTFRAYKDQEVHVTGGKQISANLFSKVTDTDALKMLPSNVISKVVQVHLPSAGITDYGTMSKFGTYYSRTSWLEIFINGEPARLAQFPNDIFLNIVSVPLGQHGKTFTYKTPEDSRWAHEKEPWGYGYWMYSWSDDATKIGHLDTQKHQMTIVNETNYGLRVGHYSPIHLAYADNQGGYFRMINMLSELDLPGEFFLDRSNGNLYIWPNTKSGTLASSDIITVSLIDDCISMDPGVNNLNFEGFTLEACRRNGITGNGLNNINVQNLDIKNLGSYGVDIRASSNITVSRCDIHYTNGGVSLYGGDRITLTPSGNVVEDNHIWMFARVGGTGYNAITIDGVGNVARYNHLHDGQYTGLMWRGNDNIMEYNHIHHMCVNSTDCGGVHSGRDWAARGNVIRYNHIHHVIKRMPGAENRGIMLDDMYSSVLIEHNVFYKNQYHVNIGGGRDNIVRHNVFYDAVDFPLNVDFRGILYNTTGGNLFAKLATVPYKTKLWSERYPKLAVIDSNHPMYPMGNVIYENAFYNKRGPGIVQFHGNGLEKKEYYNIYDNFKASPADFWSPSEHDYRFRCSAETWAKQNSFPQPIDINAIGPRQPTGPKYMQKAIQQYHSTAHPASCSGSIIG
ncbi:uncharacterized protein LOC124135175 [Haliotis rufescens]|uniref:uncharacterized protein LOC124135175 n=1 Tax=Haliotis rufescens TaxID=6454 RepID=UPI00201ED8F7|nr:uncharacterized protein LOC124135175 [Haliotis rufescens]